MKFNTVFKIKKNVSICTNLVVGQKVLIEGWGMAMEGVFEIEEIAYDNNFSSGVKLKVKGYTNWIDSGWVDEIKVKSEVKYDESEVPLCPTCKVKTPRVPLMFSDSEYRCLKCLQTYKVEEGEYSK